VPHRLDWDRTRVTAVRRGQGKAWRAGGGGGEHWIENIIIIIIIITIIMNTDVSLYRNE
jgi:hypothetical protein